MPNPSLLSSPTAARRLGGATLRTRLLLVLLLAYVPVLALTIHGHLDDRRREHTAVKENAALTARMTAAAYERFLEGARHALMAFAQLAETRHLSQAEAGALLRSLLARYPHFANMGVVEKSGGLLASALPITPPAGAAHRAYFRGVLAKNDFAVGGFESGPGISRPGIQCGFPIRDAKGAVRRVVFAAFDLQNLAYASQSLSLGAEGRVVLLDSQGTVLVSLPADKARAGDRFPALAALNAGASPQRDGIYYAASPVRLAKDTGLRVAYGVNMEAASLAAQGRFRRDIFLLAAAGAMILLLGWSAGHYFITRHVKNLVSAARRLAEGDLSARTGIVHDPGELGRLAEAVDQMAVALQRRDEELRNAHLNLERQVAERTSELRAINDQLEAFSYSVSHDLRAPLRAIDGFSQILLNEHADGLTPEGQRLLGVVVKNSKQMSQLIEDLLLFARLGRQEPRPTEVDMSSMARDVFEELAASRRERRMKLELHPMPLAMADSSMMLQVWSSLLSNAVKFTSKRADAVIEVGAEQGPTHNTFHVRDNGVGFDAQYAHRLFQVFQRLHSTAEFEGTGVGLAIVRRIVEKHGGKLWAETAPNHGATFYFSLPRAEAA